MYKTAKFLILIAGILLCNQAHAFTSVSDARAYLLSGEPIVIQIDTQTDSNGDGVFDDIGTIKNGHRMLVRYNPVLETTYANDIDRATVKKHESANASFDTSGVLSIWGASFGFKLENGSVCLTRSNQCAANILGSLELSPTMPATQIINSSVGDFNSEYNALNMTLPASCASTTHYTQKLYYRVRTAAELVYQGSKLVDFTLSNAEHNDMVVKLSSLVSFIKTNHSSSIGINTDYNCNAAESHTSAEVISGLYEYYKYNPQSHIITYINGLWNNTSTQSFLNLFYTNVNAKLAAYNTIGYNSNAQLIVQKLGLGNLHPSFITGINQLIKAQVTSASEQNCTDSSGSYTGITRGAWTYASSLFNSSNYDFCKAYIGYTNIVIGFLMTFQEMIDESPSSFPASNNLDPWYFSVTNTRYNLRLGMAALSKLQSNCGVTGCVHDRDSSTTSEIPQLWGTNRAGALHFDYLRLYEQRLGGSYLGNNFKSLGTEVLEYQYSYWHKERYNYPQFLQYKLASLSH